MGTQSTITQSTTKLTRNEARRIAANVAKLVELQLTFCRISVLYSAAQRVAVFVMSMPTADILSVVVVAFMDQNNI